MTTILPRFNFTNMIYRYMRVVVFIDLPVTTNQNRREYRAFRKHLIKSGFLMVQESVYSKLVANDTMAKYVIENIRSRRPSAGTVQILQVTEKQYSRMEYIVGEKNSEILDSDERLVII